jgi:hypothetical protein
MRLQVEGKMVPLSQYITWMCVDQEEDTIDRMTNESVSTIIHQDPFLIREMLQDVAKLFKEAVLWNRDKDDLKKLKDRVALIDYELSHAMPFYRGSAAIAEWIEMALYQYHGFTLRYLPEKLVNLEALTSPLHEFIQGELQNGLVRQAGYRRSKALFADKFFECEMITPEIAALRIKIVAGKFFQIRFESFRNDIHSG